MQSIKNLIKGETILWLMLIVFVVFISAAIITVANTTSEFSNAYELGRQVGRTIRPFLAIIVGLLLIYITIRVIRRNKK